jgi:hypothetical protein
MDVARRLILSGGGRAGMMPMAAVVNRTRPTRLQQGPRDAQVPGLDPGRALPFLAIPQGCLTA